MFEAYNSKLLAARYTRTCIRKEHAIFLSPSLFWGLLKVRIYRGMGARVVYYFFNGLQIKSTFKYRTGVLFVLAIEQENFS